MNEAKNKPWSIDSNNIDNIDIYTYVSFVRNNINIINKFRSFVNSLHNILLLILISRLLPSYIIIIIRN